MGRRMRRRTCLVLAGGLLVAIPLCVVTADPGLGRWMRDRQIAALPEEFGAASLPQTSEVYYASLEAALALPGTTTRYCNPDGVVLTPFAFALLAR